MKHKIVQTEKGKILVDEAAEIKEGETGYNSHDERFDVCTVLNKESIQEHWDKIIATINFSIDKDVPMVIVEDEINVPKMLYDLCRSTYGSGFDEWPESKEYHRQTLEQEKGVYSESDLSGMMMKISNWVLKNNPSGIDILSEIDTLIQSLKQESIELAMEQINNKSGSSYSTVTEYRIKTTRVDGQLLAYVKNKQ